MCPRAPSNTESIDIPLHRLHSYQKPRAEKDDTKVQQRVDNGPVQRNSAEQPQRRGAHEHEKDNWEPVPLVSDPVAKRRPEAKDAE